jgi:hypothetical protein
MRAISAVFAGLFLLSVAVQWNDPDPLAWMAGYGAAAALSVAALLGHLPVLPNALAAVGFTLWFATIAATLSGAPTEAFTSFHMRAASHEEPREAIGLLICALWTAFLAIRGWQQRKRSGARQAATDRSGVRR